METTYQSLREFTSMYGKKFTLSTFTDGDGNNFKSLVWELPEIDSETGKHKLLFVNFSKKLGELSAKEIIERKNELRVSHGLNEKGNEYWALCTQSQNIEDIELDW